MPVYFLTDELIFPDPEEALEDGLLALGGDLSVERLKMAYSKGIFPWYSQDSPILWWSPDPRLILFPDKLKISKSLKQVIQKNIHEIKFDTRFEEVVQNCATVDRKDQEGTWITNEMEDAYIELHKAGFAHSVETYYEGKLVGGLYGVSLGRVFFGESMFHTQHDTSKVALYHLVGKLKAWNFDFIDAQQETRHIKSLGAESVPRKLFLEMLEKALEYPTKTGKWRLND